MSKIGDLYRHFSVVVNNGSGCIFQTDAKEYTYILTVKHNLIQDEASQEYLKDTVKISRNYRELKNNIFLTVRNIYTHPEKDYAIIEVDKVKNPGGHKLHIGRYEKDTHVTISGFPNYQRNKNDIQTEHRTSLEAEVDIQRSQRNEYDLTLVANPNSFDRGAAENITGFSGSGIFQEIDDELFLCGVFPKLNDNGATHSKVVGFDLSGFQDILKINAAAKQQEIAAFEYKEDKFGKFKRFIKRNIITIGIAFAILIVAGYVIWPKNKLECESFTSTSDLNILINSVAKNTVANNQKFDSLLNQQLFPFNNNNKFMKGKVANNSSGDLKDLATNCGAQILISGTPHACTFQIIDNNITKYFQKQYPLYNPNIKLNQDIEKMACLLKFYLIEKSDTNRLQPAMLPTNCLHSIAEKPDTQDQMILQATALFYEEIGKQDSALLLYKKIDEGGMNPEYVYKRQEVLATKLNRTHDVITAQTGLIKIAQQKKDTKTEAELLQKRAKNYEKTGEKANELEDYKKIKKIKPNDQNAIRKIETLEDQVKKSPPNVASAYTPNSLVSTTNLLIKNNQFTKADSILQINKTLVKSSPELTALKAEIDYNRNVITATQIPDSIKAKNERLASQIRVDQIRLSNRALVRGIGNR
jgi:tetratricopeptide (TPR) repeat protein